MEDSFEQLKNQWKQKKVEPQAPPDHTEMLQIALKNQRAANKHHWWNIFILATTAMGLGLFFYYLATMQDIISRVGIFFMIGGLLVRIVIELFSRQRSARIEFGANVGAALKEVALFYNWRKRIHGPVTFTILALYSIGFYVLTPEFAEYISLKWIVIMDVGYVFILIFLIIVIKKGNDDEMRQLKAVVDMQSELKGEGE